MIQLIIKGNKKRIFPNNEKNDVNENFSVINGSVIPQIKNAL